MLDLAQGQDRVMLLTFINLAARRSKIFRLKWTDLDFRQNVVRLVTGKDNNNLERVDHIPMSRQLRRTLLQWWEERTIHSEHVFTMLDDAYAAGHAPPGTPSPAAATSCGRSAEGPGWSPSASTPSGT